MVTALLQHWHRCSYSGMKSCTFWRTRLAAFFITSFGEGPCRPFFSLLPFKHSITLSGVPPLMRMNTLFRNVFLFVDTQTWIRQSIFLNTPLLLFWKGHLFAAPHWAQPPAVDWLNDESRAWMVSIQWRADIKCLFFFFAFFSPLLFSALYYFLGFHN